MANTYTQIHLQIVFAVRFRAALINKTWKDELYKYMTGIVQMQKHKMIIINGVEDHVHMLIGFKPHQSLSDLVQDVKGSSSKWINERKLTKNILRNIFNNHHDVTPKKRHINNRFFFIDASNNSFCSVFWGTP